MLNVNKTNLAYSNYLTPKGQGKSDFHTQILKAWSEINSFVPITLKEIISQRITENIHIRVDNKPLKAYFLGMKNKTKLNDMRIKDIIENNWKIGKTTFIEEDLNEKISILKYLSLIKAIPKEWKDKIIRQILLLT